MDDRIFRQRALFVLFLVVLAAAVYATINLFLLIFAAIVFASILSAARGGVTLLTGLKGGWALFLAILSVFAFLASIFYLFGAQIAQEVDTIQERLPEALASAEAQLDQLGVGDDVRRLFEQGSGDIGRILQSAGGYALSASSGVADFLLVIVGGIFLAVEPGVYRRGIVALVPRHREELAGQALEDSSNALSAWLRGQVLSMVAVTALTFIGLWALGVPAAFGLAAIAGLLDFIPFVGPIIAAVPAVLLAFIVGPSTALWTVGLYLLVQQIQGNILQPMVQRFAVDVPPAVLLFAVAAAGSLFGFLGILLSGPLTVVVYVLIQRLYVQAALGKDEPVETEVP